MAKEMKTELVQVAGTFDKVTQRKMLKSLVLTAISALGVFLVALSQGATVLQSLIVALGTIGGFLVNGVDEFRKGVEK